MKTVEEIEACDAVKSWGHRRNAHDTQRLGETERGKLDAQGIDWKDTRICAA